MIGPNRGPYRLSSGLLWFRNENFLVFILYDFSLVLVFTREKGNEGWEKKLGQNCVRFID